ncbi:MAG: HAD family phosphatase, partial [Clostridiaceae bacterium]|nr:HAD family phosphatase [Clostridiaceae bacterium]
MTGAIFDFNGTMFFDEAFQERSWREFLGQKTGRDVTDAEFQEYIHGRNADVSLPYFLQRSLSRQEIEDLEEEKEVIYRDLCLKSADFRLADGLPLFLDRLKQLDFPITIATASGWNNVQFFFDHLGLDRWFNLQNVVYNDGTI